MDLAAARPYRFYRAYCLLVVVLWNAIGLIGLNRERPPGWAVAGIVALVPFVIPALFLIFSALVFKLPYSAFGPKPRTQLPDDTTLIAKRSSGGSIAWFAASIGLITWMVYKDGIGFKAWGVGRGFVPFTKVIDVRRRLGGCRVQHQSEEIRSPLRIASRSMYKAIQKILEGSGDA